MRGCVNAIRMLKGLVADLRLFIFVWREYLYLPTKVHNFTEKYVSKIYKSGQPHQNVNNLIINTCRFCINRDKWGGYKDEKFQQFTISPPLKMHNFVFVWIIACCQKSCFLKNITRKGNLNYMGQKINFYGVVVSIWTNGFFRKMDNKGEEEVENYVCFLS